MKNLIPLLLFCLVTHNLFAQAETDPRPTVNIGDPAPPLRLKEWFKGNPIQGFEKGRIYVLEFWSKGCGGCIAAMPHISALAEKYKDEVTVLGVDVYEPSFNTVLKIKSFVDSMGSRMNFLVAKEESNYMDSCWLAASGETGVPSTFVVDREGKIAWIGHPHFLENVIRKIMNNTWDNDKALAAYNRERYLDSLDRDSYYKLINYRDKPEMALFAINSLLVTEPELKYRCQFAFQTFAALLKTDMNKALEYGKEAITKRVYPYPGSFAIWGTIKNYSDKIQFTPEIYELGAEAYQAYIDMIIYPELNDLYKMYSTMAEWYMRANKKSKAIKSQEKAIENLKSKKDISAEDLSAYESRLRQYRNM
jgi:thiol-disulfide isomerase/thioredoxin